MIDVILKRFEKPDETRVFEKGKLELVELGGMTIGRASYEPGWKWSDHVGKATGQKLCQVEHLGMVVSGVATAAMRMDALLKCIQAMSFTFRRDTTVGLLAASRMYRCTLWARMITPASRSSTSVFLKRHGFSRAIGTVTMTALAAGGTLSIETTASSLRGSKPTR